MASLSEQETIIRTSADDIDAYIYTNYKPDIRRFCKFCELYPDMWMCERVDEYGGYHFVTRKKNIRYRGKKHTITVSEERKAEMRERISKAREQKG